MENVVDKHIEVLQKNQAKVLQTFIDKFLFDIRFEVGEDGNIVNNEANITLIESLPMLAQKRFQESGYTDFINIEVFEDIIETIKEYK